MRAYLGNSHLRTLNYYTAGCVGGRNPLAKMPLRVEAHCDCVEKEVFVSMVASKSRLFACLPGG
jgi:hypothetical protein